MAEISPLYPVLSGGKHFMSLHIPVKCAVPRIFILILSYPVISVNPGFSSLFPALFHRLHPSPQHLSLPVCVSTSCFHSPCLPHHSYLPVFTHNAKNSRSATRMTDRERNFFRSGPASARLICRRGQQKNTLHSATPRQERQRRS